MFAPTTSLFHHDYASPAAAQPVADHSLAQDLRLFTSSPNSLTMYEQEQLDLPSSLPSTCSDNFTEVGSLDDFDLKPQFECNTNNFLKLDLEALNSSFDVVNRGDPVWSPTEVGLLKMEDVFQVDKREVIQGPTLAALNADDSFSIYDDMSIMSADLEQTGGLANAWKPVVTSSVFTFPTSVCQTAAHTTTCTITSPTQQVPAICTSSSDLCKVSAAPYTVTAKFSLLPENVPQKTVASPTIATPPQCAATTAAPPASFEQDSKSSLQQLLMQSRPASEKVLEVAPPVCIKQEPVVAEPEKEVRAPEGGCR